MEKIGFFISDSKWNNYQRWIYNTAVALYAEGQEVIVIASKKSYLYTRLKRYGIDVIAFRKNGLLLTDSKRLYQICKDNGLSKLIFNHPRDIRITGLVARFYSFNKLVFRRGTLPVRSRNQLDYYLVKKYISFVITNSKANKEAMKNSRSSLFRNKPVNVIYNGIKNTSHNARVQTPEFNFRNNGELIVGLSDCAYNREFCKQLLDYIKQVNINSHQIRFLIYPDWRSNSSFARELSKFKFPDGVNFYPKKSPIADFMQKIDVYLSPVVGKSFNYSLIYAMDHSKPVLALYGGSNIEIVGDQRNGYLIDENQMEVLLDKMYHLRDEQLRNAMGQEGKKLVHRKFTYQSSVDKIRQVFKSQSSIFSTS